MNARASQPELPKSAVTLSSGAEGFASRSAEVAESVGAKQAHIVVAPSMGGQRHHDAAPQCYGEERLTQREFSLFRSAAVDSQPGSLIKSAAGGSQPESLIETVSGLPPRSVWLRIPFYLIGLLLTATASAKLWMLLTDSFADIRVGLPKEILWLSVAFEFWLAYENVRLRDHRVMAFVNTLVFASFAIFASVRLAMGYSSCGCSGSLEIPAWVFILIDVGVVVWFFSTLSADVRLGSNSLLKSWPSWSQEKRGCVVGLGIFTIFVIALQDPNVASYREIILGEQPIQAIVRIDNRLSVNQESTAQVEIQNHSAIKTNVTGFNRSCKCLEMSEDIVSKTIPANGHIVYSLVIQPSHPGPFHQRFILFLDHPKQFRLNVDVIGFAEGNE
jgi:hypothetical protein